jgi:predicted DNA-binding helix-hairpin-helix protein
VYYGTYVPIDGGPEGAPASPRREHRLYQADWLMRFYGFDVNELTTAQAPNLDLKTDPKTAWALRHPETFPVDVNVASRELLLRVPGLGQRSVERILRSRRLHRLTLEDLRTLGIRLTLARPFVITTDWRPRRQAEAAPADTAPVQQLLWTA